MIGGILLAHLAGDYLLQSDWMAIEKTKRWWPAIAHGLVYTLPFALLTQSWEALAVIAGTHVVIDRFRLARHVCWAKNWLAPVRLRRGCGECLAMGRNCSLHVGQGRDDGVPRFVVEAYNPPWGECRATGYPPNRPAWMTVWLMIIADNTMHLLFNVAAIRWLG